VSFAPSFTQVEAESAVIVKDTFPEAQFVWLGGLGGTDSDPDGTAVGWVFGLPVDWAELVDAEPTPDGPLDIVKLTVEPGATEVPDGGLAAMTVPAAY
jgi:hypothetical protein